jgi:hypothetical protein
LFSDVMNFADFAALSIKICACKTRPKTAQTLHLQI